MAFLTDNRAAPDRTPIIIGVIAPGIIAIACDCKCADFAEDLLKLLKEMLDKDDEITRWKAFQQFKRYYFLNNKSYLKDGFVWVTCSPNIRCTYLKKVEEFTRSGMEISTLIVDLVASIYLKDCVTNCRCFLENKDKTSPLGSEFETLRVLAAFRGKVFFMKSLLSFDYILSLPAESSLVRKAAERIMFNFMLSVSGTDDTYSIFGKIMDRLKSFLRCNEDGEFYRRMFFVGIALQAIRHWVTNDYSEAKNFVYSLRMYFSATRDQLLTIFEVRSVLYGSFIMLNKLNLFDKYSELFDNLMLEYPPTVQPRKLTHLTRYQVRQNLKNSKLPLPSAIEKLYLPSIVKSFILGDMLHFPSKNGNASAKNAVTKSELARLLFERPSF